MKAIIIDAFNNYDIRTKYVRDRLVDLGYETTILTSDFSHGLKTKYIANQESTVFLNVKPYKKNLSLKRIRSHLNFSKQAYKRITVFKPDLIYCLLPLNSLAKKLNRYKKTNENVKIYFDIFDLWPESLPTISFLKRLLSPWRNMRDKNIGCAERVILECSFYRRFLPESVKYEILYLCKEKRNISFKDNFDTLNLLYLGAINNIIDVASVVELLSRIQKCRKINLHIIGGGESEQFFLNELRTRGIPHTFWGRVYDEEKKDEIISSCHFGINMYKSDLCIGLTMKSLEYFSRGLPLINGNIPDTMAIINEEACGINVENNLGEAAFKIQALTYGDWLAMHKNCERAFEKYFSPEILNDKLKNIFTV